MWNSFIHFGKLSLIVASIEKKYLVNQQKIKSFSFTSLCDRLIPLCALVEREHYICERQSLHLNKKITFQFVFSLHCVSFFLFISPWTYLLNTLRKMGKKESLIFSVVNTVSHWLYLPNRIVKPEELSRNNNSKIIYLFINNKHVR